MYTCKTEIKSWGTAKPTQKHVQQDSYQPEQLYSLIILFWGAYEYPWSQCSFMCRLVRVFAVPFSGRFCCVPVQNILLIAVSYGSTGCPVSDGWWYKTSAQCCGRKVRGFGFNHFILTKTECSFVNSMEGVFPEISWYMRLLESLQRIRCCSLTTYKNSFS